MSEFFLYSCGAEHLKKVGVEEEERLFLCIAAWHRRTQAAEN